MSEVSIPPKATPGRRRNGRGQSKTSAPKAYASENDAIMVDQPRFCDSPQTPVKNSSVSASRNHAPGSQASKARTRTKNKPNTSASPDTTPAAQQTTPQRPASMSTTKSNMAFAGATFHASPAPSALPMPTFFTKASESPAPRSTTNRVQPQPSPPATDHELLTSIQTSSAPQNNGSPLDFMFRAHREEKERQRRGSSLSQKPATDFGFSPFQSPADRSAANAITRGSQRRNSLIKQSSSGRIDSKELDGEQGLPLGPAFSTPYQDRIRAAQTNQNRPHPNQLSKSPLLAESQSLEDRTEALKKFLFSEGFSKAPQPSEPIPSTNNMSSPNHGIPIVGSFHPATHHNTSHSHPPVSYERPNDIQAMENDLRRILKLNPAAQERPNGEPLFQGSLQHP